MLVLSRKSEESVIIGGFNSPKRELKVTVLDIKGRSVRLGFEVNKDDPAHQAEALEQVQVRAPPDCPTGGV
jgi:carbon storage regulator CsrA